MERGVKSIVGWLIAAFGLLGAAMEIDNLLKGQSQDPVFGFVLAGVCIAGGGALIMSARRAKLKAGEALQTHQLEQGASRDTLVLQAARAHGGRVTAAEVAADTVLSYEMADAELKDLAQKGACRMVVSEAGVVVFHFPEFESAQAKGRDFV